MHTLFATRRNIGANEALARFFPLRDYRAGLSGTSTQVGGPPGLYPVRLGDKHSQQRGTLVCASFAGWTPLASIDPPHCSTIAYY